jgi:uncharacterized protein (DUF2267 family)
MRIGAEDFCSHVASHAGVSGVRAEHATHAVLAGIGSHLSATHRQLVAEELPPRLAGWLNESAEQSAQPIEERVVVAGMPAGQARELVASVCRVLAEELSVDAQQALQSSLPPTIAAWLTPGSAATERPPGSDRTDTLATGRPGSHHPVSESAGERRHADSIAAANPHDDTKLSSAHGTTQERDETTLAEGRPGPTRGIARSRS